MSTRVMYGVLGVWFAIVAGIVVAGLLAGMHVSLATSVLILVLSVTPPVIVLTLFGGKAPQTVAEMLRR